MEITGKKGPEGVVKAVCTSEKKVLKNILYRKDIFLKILVLKEMPMLVNGTVR